MRRLWSEESVTFEGRHFQYKDVSISPRPVQQPLPLWIGGHSPAAVRRTARVGTGYLAGLVPPAQLGKVVIAIKTELAAVGRTIDPDHYGVTLPYRFGSFDDPPVQRIAAARAAAAGEARGWLAVGDADAIRRALQAYVDVGISKFVMIPLARGEDDLVLQTRRLVEETIPSFESSTPPRAAAAG